MSSDIAILAHGLGKTYRAYRHPLDRLLQRVPFGGGGRFREFHALRGVSFEIRRGETVGIIGRNGSGKSTLLQLICGIRRPTAGTVAVNGRVAALLELGAGFHPEFTGRENVFLQGAIQGLSREEMEGRFDDIVAFADVGAFIDQPVKTYSSGMFVRLAFAVAVHVEPDILVVDEALAVGDALFQKRCYARLRQMRQKGLTLVFVSHDHELVRTLTERALLLDRGEALYWGDTREATHRYRKMLFEQEALDWARQTPDAAQPDISESDPPGPAYGIGGARITGLRILGPDGEPRSVFRPGERMDFEIAVSVESHLDRLNIGVVIKTVQGWKVYSWGTLNQDIVVWAGGAQGDVFWEKSFQPGDEVIVTLSLEGNLGAGNYEVQGVVSRELERGYGSQQVLHWRDEMGFFRVEMNPREYFFGGVCDLHGKARFHG